MAVVNIRGLTAHVYVTHVRILLPIFGKANVVTQPRALKHTKRKTENHWIQGSVQVTDSVFVPWFQLHAEYCREKDSYLPHRVVQAWELQKFVRWFSFSFCTCVTGVYSCWPELYHHDVSQLCWWICDWKYNLHLKADLLCSSILFKGNSFFFLNICSVLDRFYFFQI